MFFLTSNTSPGRVRSRMTPCHQRLRERSPGPSLHKLTVAGQRPPQIGQIFYLLAPASSPLRVSGKVSLMGRPRFHLSRLLLVFSPWRLSLSRSSNRFAGSFSGLTLHSFHFSTLLLEPETPQPASYLRGSTLPPRMFPPVPCLNSLIHPILVE